MKFVDASVFLHAYLMPAAKKLPGNIEELKRNARRIVSRINEGEPVVTSLVHVSEIANILESRMPFEDTLHVLSGLMSLNNLEVLEVTRTVYQEAIEDSLGSKMGVNDSLACVLMRRRNLSEIYSFDTDFDRSKEIKRISN